MSRAARGCALLFFISALAACLTEWARSAPRAARAGERLSARVPPPDRSKAGGPDGSTGAPREPTPRAVLPRIEISISYVANLVHFIDNLAGSSQGKSIDAYRRYWERRFGTPTPQEMDLLRDWVEIRGKAFPRPGPKPRNDGGCLPQMEDLPDWRRTFRIRSYEAPTVEAFLESMKSDLTFEEIASLRRTIETFSPRFDEVWKETIFLPRFEERFNTFLKDQGFLSYLGEVAAFFGVDPGAHPPGILHLMALPEEVPTHAQADGRHLLVEIRPNDTPVEQIQVISHEISHYFWSLVPPDRNDALARQVHAAGPHGAVVWSLLREALPTALGQGLAESRLAPFGFTEDQRWYHVDEVDRFAKQIYPLVAAAFRDKKRIDEGILQEIMKRAASDPAIAHAPPAEYLGSSFFAIGEEMWRPYAEIRRSARVQNGWPGDAGDPNAAAFAARYECLSGVVLIGPEDLKKKDRLPPLFVPPARAERKSEEAAPPLDPRGWIAAVRRSGGGTIFYLVAARPEEITRIGPAFLGLRRAPEEPVLVE